MKQVSGAKFYIANVEWFNGDIENILNKIVERKAKEEAKWIDEHIKRLLPGWIVKVAPKYYKYRFFRFLVRHIFDIDVSILSDPLMGKRIVTIGQRGKEVFSKKFND